MEGVNIMPDQAELTPEQKAASQLAGVVYEALQDYNHGLALHILAAVVAHQIYQRTALSREAAMMATASFNSAVTTNVILSFGAGLPCATDPAAGEEAPPPGATVN